jgi:metal-responsive CopG/Arc/MetJ family transcriptional regulator
VKESILKIAISLPDSVFEAAEALAQQLGMSRSELYCAALQDYLQRLGREQMLSKLNEVYSHESLEANATMPQEQRQAPSDEDW